MPRRTAPARLLAPVALLAALLALAGCNYHYQQGKALEAQERWEEAAIEYRLAYIEDPDDPDFQQALERANKVVARDNFERYQDYLANKEFAKAYQRLRAAARQDPAYQPVQAELQKWVRVLVSGQVEFSFESLRSNLSLADRILLMARLNTPNPGETIEAEIDINTGVFFVEDLLYEPPDELLTYYTLNAIGVRLVRERNPDQMYTSREFIRFVSFRTPVLDRVQGRVQLNGQGPLRRVNEHRDDIEDPAVPSGYWVPGVNLHYSMNIRGDEIHVDSEEGRADFTPRFIYLNRENRRMFVDFGRYEVRQNPDTGRWGLTRLPLAGQDYFRKLSENVALQPYFFYHGPALKYRNADSSRPAG